MTFENRLAAICAALLVVCIACMCLIGCNGFPYSTASDSWGEEEYDVETEHGIKIEAPNAAEIAPIVDAQYMEVATCWGEPDSTMGQAMTVRVKPCVGYGADGVCDIEDMWGTGVVHGCTNGISEIWVGEGWETNDALKHEMSHWFVNGDDTNGLGKCWL